MYIYVIGCGGGASYLLPPLYRALASLPKQHTLYLVDRDTLEARNLSRQNFLAEGCDRSKAEAMANMLKSSVDFPQVQVKPLVEYITRDSRLRPMPDVLFAMVDNHPARASALHLADYYKCPCICAANEQHSAEAYIYLPANKGTATDPRTFYPEIETVTTDDPTRPSCNEVIPSEPSPQGALANALSAAAAMHLFQAHIVLGHALTEEYRSLLPFHVKVNSFNIETVSFKQTLQPVLA